MENNQDLRINGATDVSGGTYNQIHINGKSTLNGDVDCVEFNTAGLSKVKGNLETGQGKIAGKTTIEGTAELEKLEISGSVKIKETANIEKLRLTGKMKVKDSLSAEQIEGEGKLNVAGDCEAELFDFQGRFDVAELLTADEIDVDINGPAQVQEIGGENIEIKQGLMSNFKKLVNVVFSFLNLYETAGKLSVESIEGDDIYLEATKAKLVRGNNVEVGPDCEIEVVEYKNNFKQDEESKVNEYKQI